MALRERTYSVLVVSASNSFNAALSELLSGGRYDPVNIVGSIAAAKRTLDQRSFDLVIINAPLPDDIGIHLAIDLGHSPLSSVLLLVSSEIHAAVHERVSEHGVFTLSKPVSRDTVVTALEWLEASCERIRGLAAKTVSLQEKMEEIRVVNRAKLLLIAEKGMDEPAAHRYVEKQAMDRCVTRSEIAEEVIRSLS